MSYPISDRNEDFVNFAAAFAGRISANFRAVDFVAKGPTTFECRVVLKTDDPDDRNAIAEALGDFEAMRRPLYELAYSMKCEVVVSHGNIGHPANHELRLFAAREV